MREILQASALSKCFAQPMAIVKCDVPLFGGKWGVAAWRLSCSARHEALSPRSVGINPRKPAARILRNHSCAFKRASSKALNARMAHMCHQANIGKTILLARAASLALCCISAAIYIHHPMAEITVRRKITHALVVKSRPHSAEKAAYKTSAYR